METNGFLATTAEREDLNQYWYSRKTIEAMVQEILHQGGKAVFLSTPSVYFSVPKESREGFAVFDFDEQWRSDPGYVKWDFKEPTAFPEHLRHSFDIVVIDPPFITREVWEQYAAAAKELLKDASGKIIASTIYENASIMSELLNCKPQKFLPSIPHLVYQYNFYCNFETTHLSKPNPEIPED